MRTSDIYRLNNLSPEPENHAHITRDNPGDTSFDVNHISPEENGEIRAPDEQLR